MHNDWLFKNNAGYIGETFFCFSSNNCQDLIYYQDVEWIGIIKKREPKYLISLIGIQAFIFILLDIFNFSWELRMVLLLIFMVGLGFVYFRLPIYKYQIKILLKDECFIVCDVPKDYLHPHYELIKIIKNIKKDPSKQIVCSALVSY
jgi:hypothetical protein